jgi:O-antigen/teichoic acid export membrane protein
MILGRLLQPADLGIAALVTSVYIWLEQLGQTGLQTTLLQKQGDIRPHLCTAWTINLSRSVVATLAMFVTAPFAAQWFNMQDLTNMLRVASLGFVILALQSPATVYTRRELNFDKEVRVNAISTLAGLIVTIVAAVQLRNAWAVIFAMLCTQVCQAALSYWIQPFRPRLEYDRNIARELFSFSRWIMLSNFALFPLRYLPTIMIGKLLGSGPLGFYQVASQLAFVPTSQIGVAFGGLLLPAFVKIEDPTALRRNLLRVLTLIGTVVLPAACFVSLFAHLVLRIMMGEKWLASAPITQVLVWAGAFTAVTDMTSPIVIRLGHPKYIAFMSTARSVFLLAVFYPALKTWGVQAMANILLIAAVGRLIVQFFVMTRLLPVRWQDFLRTQEIGASAAVPFVIAFFLMTALAPSPAGQTAIAGGALLCCGAVLFLFRQRLMQSITGRKADAGSTA